MVKGLVSKPEDMRSIRRILRSSVGLHVRVLLVPGRSRQQIPVIRWSASLAYLEHCRPVKERERERWRRRSGGTERRMTFEVDFWPPFAPVTTMCTCVCVHRHPTKNSHP